MENDIIFNIASECITGQESEIRLLADKYYIDYNQELRDKIISLWIELKR